MTSKVSVMKNSKRYAAGEKLTCVAVVPGRCTYPWPRFQENEGSAGQGKEKARMPEVTTSGRRGCLPQVPTDDPTVQGDESATITADEAASESAGECMTTPLVHHACDTTEETDVDPETGNLTPEP
ncbi:hypothetical protein NDU88_000096 [Pleurodeles waltl]|uniref:Uncharacterized protein n=1 Tax=Pleurodeles waltl TaxID=8319 RepID=A0AAV7V498_PLEWA|nr:hypothetical protein NDU88_000096 [Pleurodeles waltl]